MTRRKRAQDDTLDQMVSSFAVKRRMRTVVLAIAGASLVALALGFSFAMLGGAKNPLRQFLEQRGYLPGRELAEKAYVHHTTIAQTAWARGDIADYERAEELLEKAKTLRDEHGSISADLALIYASHADALMRLAADDADDAEKLEEGDAKERMQKIAALRHRKASELVAKAKEEAAQAEKQSPESVATMRAMVEVARVAADEMRERVAISQLEKHLEATANEDAWSHEVLARAAVPDPARADSASIEAALKRLERAIELEPKLDRARVQRARILAARGAFQDAEKELTAVLGDMPSYEEAQRVLGRVKKELETEIPNAAVEVES